VSSETDQLARVIGHMRAAFASGGNAMGAARSLLGSEINDPVATLVAYDLQAGSYIRLAKANPELNRKWGEQIAELLRPFANAETSLLEVGSGEATTLATVIQALDQVTVTALGFDCSWSRVAQGQTWLAEQRVTATTFVGDLFRIPLADESVDIVYTSHSLEPNGGREKEAIRECMRVARTAVILVEPAYELADVVAQARMREHGYVRGLLEAARSCGADVRDYRLLPLSKNPLNPSGVLALAKSAPRSKATKSPQWQCPLTGAPLDAAGDVFIAREMGIVYPVLRGIPLLRTDHAVVAGQILG
jgi:ubiquinone/menaquinone biosynthesis C-methylase UbiE